MSKYHRINSFIQATSKIFTTIKQKQCFHRGWGGRVEQKPPPPTPASGVCSLLALCLPLDHVFPYNDLPHLHNSKSPAEVRPAPPSLAPYVPLAQPSSRRDPGEQGPLHRPVHLPVPSRAPGHPRRALSRSRTSTSQAHEARRGTHPPLPSPSTSSSMHPAPGALRRPRPGSYRPPSGAPPPACPRPQAGPLPTARRRRPLPRHGTPFGLRSPPRSGGGGGYGGGGPSRSSGGGGSSAAPAPPRRPPEPHAPPARPAAGLLPPKPTTKPPRTPQPRSVRIQLSRACCPFLTPLRTRGGGALGFVAIPLPPSPRAEGLPLIPKPGPVTGASLLAALGFALRPLAFRPGAKRVESLHAGISPLACQG